MTPYINEQYTDLEATARRFREEYIGAEPFPSIAIEEFFNPQMLDRVLAEFPDLSKQDAQHFNNVNEKKFAGKGELSFGDETRKFMHYLNSEPFLKFLQTITGIEETLLGDPYYTGGGLHEIKRGGLLKVHADFNKHRPTGLDRRINVLVYLNKDWKEEYGGHFELWDTEMKQCVKRVLPQFNTLAMFTTTTHSYHGHPDPLECPDGLSRKSLALYYYTNGRPAHEVDPDAQQHSTLFQQRAGHASDQDVGVAKQNSSLGNFARDLVPPIVIKGLKKVTGKS